MFSAKRVAKDINNRFAKRVRVVNANDLLVGCLSKRLANSMYLGCHYGQPGCHRF